MAFFLLAALSLLEVYFADPSIYTKTLTFESTVTDRYPLSATLFLFGIFVFITVLMVGVTRHWRWLFWLILIAFGFSVLQIPAAILQLAGVIPNSFPVWYSLYRMGIALFQAIIAVWMMHIYRHYGVWAMGKQKNSSTIS